MSTFNADLNKLVLSSDFADIIFLWPFDESTSSECENIIMKLGMKYHRIYAHKAILCQLEYFEAMFSGHFRYVKSSMSTYYCSRVIIKYIDSESQEDALSDGIVFRGMFEGACH